VKKGQTLLSNHAILLFTLTTMAVAWKSTLTSRGHHYHWQTNVNQSIRQAVSHHAQKNTW